MEDVKIKKYSSFYDDIKTYIFSYLHDEIVKAVSTRGCIVIEEIMESLDKMLSKNIEKLYESNVVFLEKRVEDLEVQNKYFEQKIKEDQIRSETFFMISKNYEGEKQRLIAQEIEIKKINLLLLKKQEELSNTKASYSDAIKAIFITKKRENNLVEKLRIKTMKLKKLKRMWDQRITVKQAENASLTLNINELKQKKEEDKIKKSVIQKQLQSLVVENVT